MFYFNFRMNLDGLTQGTIGCLLIGQLQVLRKQVEKMLTTVVTIRTTGEVTEEELQSLKEIRDLLNEAIGGEKLFYLILYYI